MTIAKIALASVAALIISSAALAQEAHTGRIVKIDQANGNITLQHKPAGTVGTAGVYPMVDDYKIQDGPAFNTLKAGDEVDFTAAQVGGAWTVTKIQKQ
jgi:Cu/Ag efflux protein CusF